MNYTRQYEIRVTPKPSKTHWETNKVEIWDIHNKELSFEFTRKYPSHAKETTKIFEYWGKQYLIYSGDYETIEFFNLSDKEKVELTEESKAQLQGMCPVDIIMPQYRMCRITSKECPDMPVYFEEGKYSDRDKADAESTPSQFHEFGFVAGCVWGDDSGWKINLLDISKLHKGEVYYRTSLKGPKNWLYEEIMLPLKDSFAIDYWGDEYPIDQKAFKITIAKAIQLGESYEEKQEVLAKYYKEKEEQSQQEQSQQA